MPPLPPVLLLLLLLLLLLVLLLLALLARVVGDDRGFKEDESRMAYALMDADGRTGEPSLRLFSGKLLVTREARKGGDWLPSLDSDKLFGIRIKRVPRTKLGL